MKNTSDIIIECNEEAYRKIEREYERTGFYPDQIVKFVSGQYVLYWQCTDWNVSAAESGSLISVLTKMNNDGTAGYKLIRLTGGKEPEISFNENGKDYDSIQLRKKSRFQIFLNKAILGEISKTQTFFVLLFVLIIPTLLSWGVDMILSRFGVNTVTASMLVEMSIHEDFMGCMLLMAIMHFMIGQLGFATLLLIYLVHGYFLGGINIMKE